MFTADAGSVPAGAKRALNLRGFKRVQTASDVYERPAESAVS